MAAASSRRSCNGPLLRSLSPSGRFHNFHNTFSPSPSPSSRSSSASSSSSAFAYSSSSFSSRSSTFFHRSASSTLVNLCAYNQSIHSSSAHSVRFTSPPNHSITPPPSKSTTNQVQFLKNQTQSKPKRTCMCSPTTHRGSFRCCLHKSFNSSQTVYNHSPNNRLDARRSAMTNSLVRIGGVEGDLTKRALAALNRPSSH